MVFTMVVVGGITRLTRSGLSMVEWKFTGEKPPLTQEEWEAEFEKYKQYPEYKKLNQGMTLEEFKKIYFWEFFHRWLGRTMGVVFLVPFMYFLARGRIKRHLVPSLVALFGLGAAQGLVGWWMVKSGLKEELLVDYAHPRVSPYRLATHLIWAFVIYTLLFRTACHAYFGKAVANTPAIAGGVPPVLRKVALGTTALVFLTAFSGAFVAGNQAGLCYNEFPLMGGRIVPQDIIDPNLKPAWRNIFENSTTVQFQHRVLGVSTVLVTLAQFLFARRFPISRSARRAVHAVMAWSWVQVALGISTLLMYVPTHLAATHQAGALTLLTLALWYLFRLGPSQGSRRLAAAAAHLKPSQQLHNVAKRPFSVGPAISAPLDRNRKVF